VESIFEFLLNCLILLFVLALAFSFLQSFLLKSGTSNTKISCNLKECFFTIENSIKKAPTQSNLAGPDCEDAIQEESFK